MSNIVDVVGIEGVLKFIASSKLTKFIIFRNGAKSGSTPVYDASDCNTNQQICSSFRSWADNILMANPSNTNPYEMYLFDKKMEIDLDDELMGSPAAGKGKITKQKRVRFSFCLANFNPYAGMNGNNVNIQEAIKQGIEAHKQQDLIQTLLIEVRSLKKQIEEDDDEPEAQEDMLTKAFNFIKETNENIRLTKSSVQMAGDKNVLKEETTKSTADEVTTEEIELIKKFKLKNPSMYAQYLATLKKVV